MNSSAFPRARNRPKSRPTTWLVLLASVLSGCGSTPQSLENPYLTQSHPWVDKGVHLAATLTSGFLSDQQWDSATNGWGPVERDRSNAESVAGDGRIMTINGRTFTKGLGTHAVSEVTYSLAGNCSSFLATVGVDDEVDLQNRWGTIGFEVYGDTTKLFDSGVMSGTSPAQNISVNLTGRQSLRLVVTNGGDNVYYDHGDWAEARVTCGALNPVGCAHRLAGRCGSRLFIAERQDHHLECR
jgi:NPCBM/NEW2 domain